MVEADPFIRFYCNNCGYKSTVSESYAGKTIRCPKCYNIISIPKIKSTGTTGQSSPGKPKTGSQHSDYDLTLLDISEKEKISTFQRGQASISEETAEYEQELEEDSQEEIELVDERKLPWPVDIFLYPISASGMIHIAIFLIVPILIGLLSRFVFSYAGLYGGILSLILYVFLIGYMFYYFGECIRDSAAGGLRAPETLGSMPGLAVLLEQFVSLFACYAFFLGPVTFYRGYIYFSNMQMNSAIFWSLYAYGVFFFPMGILAVVMFGSVNGLNPILLICSIASTFFQYCGLVIFFSGLYVLRILILSVGQRWGILANVMSNIVLIWLLLVTAHLLGRFYWRYQEKLNWEV